MKDLYEDAVLQVLEDGRSYQMPSIEKLASWKLSGVSFREMEVRRAVWRLLNSGVLQMDFKLNISLAN